LECLAFSSPPALIADENRFSWSGFGAGASDVDRLHGVVVGIDLFAVVGIVSLSYMHGSDESRFGAGMATKLLHHSCRIPIVHPFANCGHWKIFPGSAKVPSATEISRINFFSQFS
jgi:hypothetical protein